MSQTDGSQSQTSRQSMAISSLSTMKKSEAKVVYPFISSLDTTAPRLLVKALLVLEALQLLALVINPTVWNSGSIVSGVGIPVYFSILPFWDQAYNVVVPHSNGSAFVWVISGLMILMGANALFLMYAISEQLNKFGQGFTKAVFHMFSGPLFFPALHYLMAYSVCTPGGQLSSFLEVECWNDAYQLVLFVLAIMGTALLCSSRLASTTFYFDDLPRSNHLKSRGETFVELLVDCTGIIFTVLFHYLPAVGQRQTLSALVAGGTFILGSLHAGYLPFTHQSVNEFRVASMWVVSYCALLRTILLEETDSEAANYSREWDALLFFGGSVLVAIIAKIVAGIRVNRRCLAAVDAAKCAQRSANFVGTFPANLPTSERTKHRELEQMLLGENAFNLQQLHNTNPAAFELRSQREEIWVGEPFVDTVIVPSDVEVANRFLALFASATGLVPPMAMIAFSVRIYAKGIARFVSSPTIDLHLASMVSSFCNGKAQAAMYMLERVGKHNHGLVVGYRVYKRMTEVASTMLIKDNSHRKVFSTALQMHKDALHNMQIFWGKLLSDHVNTVQLGVLAKSITEKREEGYKYYERVIGESSDTTSMIRFAQFLEHVMIDGEAADMCRESVLDSIEMEQTGGAQGQKSAPQVNTILSSNRASMSSDRSRTIRNLSRNINGIFGVLFTVIVGLFVFGLIHSEGRLKEINKIHFAGETRTLSQETVLLAVRLSRTTSASEAAAVHEILSTRVAEFRKHHSELLHGTYRSTHKAAVSAFAEPRWDLRANDTRESVSLLVLANAILSSLESIVAMDPVHVNEMRSAALDFLSQNVLASAPVAFNHTLDMFELESRSQLETGQYSMIALYILSVLTICGVYYVLILNLHRIIASKMSTLNLFTLIPKKALEKLHDESKQRITNFDAQDETFLKMKVARGLEDDDDAMNQVMKDVKDDIDEDQPPAVVDKAGVNVGESVVAVDDSATAGDLDMPSKFAAIARNADIADTGKVKQRDGVYEASFSKTAVAPVKKIDSNKPAQIDDDVIDQDLAAFEGVGVGAASTGTGNTAEGDEAEDAKHHAEAGERYFAISMGLLGVVIVIMVATIGFSIFEFSSIENAAKRVKAAEDLMTDIQLLYTKIKEKRRAVDRIAVFHTQVEYDNYLGLLSERISSPVVDNIVKASRFEVRKNLYTALQVSRVYDMRVAVAMRLVCNANNLTCPDFSSQTWESSDFDIEQGQRKMKIESHGWQADLALPLDAQNELGTEIISSDLQNSKFERIVSLLNAAATDVMNDARAISDEYETLKVYSLPAVIALSCVGFAVAMAFAFTIAKSHVANLTFILIGILVSCLCAVVMAVAASRAGDASLSGPFGDLLDFNSHANNTIHSLDVTNDLALRAFLHRDELATLRLAEASQHHFVDLEAGYMLENIEPENIAKFSAAIADSRSSSYVDLVAGSLTCVLWGVDEPTELQAIQWNFTNDALFRRKSVFFSDQHFYASRSVDSVLPRANLTELIRDLLLGPFRQSLANSSVSATATVSAYHRKHLLDSIDKGLGVYETKLLTDIALCAVVVVVAVLVFLVFLVRAAKGGMGSKDANKTQKADTLFLKLSRETQIALAVLTVLFTILFIVTMVDLGASLPKARDQSASSLREYELVRSLVVGQRGANLTRYNRLTRDVAEGTLLASDAMYFGTGSGYGLVGTSQTASMDDTLFGSVSADYQRYSCTPTSPNTPNSSILFALESGVDCSQRSWSDEIVWLTKLGNVASEAKLQEMEGAIGSVLEKMRLSTTQYKDILLDETQTFRIIFMVILAVTLLVLIYQFFFVFRPMIKELLHEEEGTKVMLKMIPAEVRDSVPAIAEYLETGIVLADRKMQEINEAAADLSPIPTISIDFQGTILKFSRAAEDAFLWSKEEVLGKNITILQPESVAVEHDEYLARYRRTGVRKIIGKQRKVRALRKDGSLFPAEITVKEIRSEGVTTFVGVLRNISVEMEFERATALSKAVSEAATVPIIVISSTGTILRFNTAAEETFGHNQEIIGNNVKYLMPNAEAEVHDQYLETYMKTGVKNIIDQSRRIKAKKKSGEIFPAQISVRELKSGKDSVFIGYVQDFTKQVHLQMASMVSDAIAATSPVPLVSIDEVGTIISWSPAAEKVFALSAVEAMGKNVKVIMPTAIAAKHDGYLAAFAKTGRKKIIGNITTMKGRRRSPDGNFETFPVRLAVQDITQAGKPTTFVAFVQDILSQQTMDTENRISAGIRSMCAIPLITISEVGTILTFSASATHVFGYEEDEIVGQNIKMLMPTEIAEKHDEYLAKYKETGVKNIIGSTRRLHGIRKNGKRFPAEISVHETISDGVSTYIGYVRDVTADLMMIEQNSVNDAISQLATVPMITISVDGTILACSDSTLSKFKWSAEELIGQNIKVLMPDSVAVNHDGYLQNYRKRHKELGVEGARETSALLHRMRIITAKTRDDVTFPVEVHVRDLHIDGLEPMFVGYIRDITEDVEQRTQRHIAEVIIETSTIPLVCIDRLGTITVFSASAEKDFGYKRNEVLGKNVKMLMPESVAKNHDGFLRAYSKTGIKSVIDAKRQVTAVRKTGEHFNVEIMVKENLHRDVSGKEISEYMGFVKDLTSQYILQQANMINEVVSQLSSVPIIIINPRGIILDFNKAAERDFGYRPEEVMSKNIKMLMPQSIADNHDGYLQRYLATGKKTIIDSTRVVTGKRRNGDEFMAEVSVKEVKKEGSESQYLGYVRDVTAEKMIEAAFNMNSTIVSLSVIPLIVIDTIGTIEAFSKSAEETFGLDASPVGKNIKSLMPEEIAVNHDGYLRRYLETGVKAVIDSSRVVRGRRGNGEQFPMEIRVKEVKTEEGGSKYVGYAKDITKLQTMKTANEFADTCNALSPAPIISIKHDGTIIRFSTAAEKEFGVTEKQIVGQNIKMLQPQSVARNHDGYLQRYFKTGIKRVVDTTRQVTAKRMDGTEFPCEITVREVPDNLNPENPPTFVGYVRNLELERKIGEASKEGQATRELCPIPVCAITPQGVILDANSALMRTFEYTKEELIGSNVKMLMPQHIAKHHDGYLRKYLDTGVKTVVDTIRRVTGQRKSGRQFTAEISVRELNIGGVEKQFVGYIQDVTEELRKQTSAELNDAVNELSTTPIIAITPKGIVLKFPSSAEKLFGYTASQVIGQNVKMLLPEEIAVNHDGYLKKYLETGVKAVIDSSRRVQAKHRDGHKFNVEIGVREIQDEEGKPSMFVGFIQTLDRSTNVGQDAEVNRVMIDLASQGVIIIDSIGTIEKINNAALSLFKVPSGNSPVGQNIKMLMPESTAVNHDGYLKRYFNTGVKTVIDTKRHVAGREVSTGREFPIEISVKELKERGKPTKFLGYLRPLEQEMDIALQKKINGSILSLSAYATIAIDIVGTVWMFSQVAETMFKVKASEVIGKNIKMLMPEATAAQHDEFLMRYRRTGEKHVIDTNRVVTAQAPGTDDKFQVELQIKELDIDGNSQHNMYVGFVQKL